MTILYYLAKLLQATGLTIMAMGFITHFPHLMDHNLFWLSVGFFTCGWSIQKFLIHY